MIKSHNLHARHLFMNYKLTSCQSRHSSVVTDTFFFIFFIYLFFPRVVIHTIVKTFSSDGSFKWMKTFLWKSHQISPFPSQMLGCVEDGGGVSGNNTAKPVTQECMCFYISKCETDGDT